MPALKGRTPVLSTRFELELDGAKDKLVFTAVSGMNMSTTAANTSAFAKGGRAIIKNPGNQEPTELSLTRQLDEEKFMWDWFDKLVGGDVDFKNGSLVLYGGNNVKEELVRYNFVEAWPSRVAVNGFDAGGKETLTEEVTLVCYQFTRVK